MTSVFSELIAKHRREMRGACDALSDLIAERNRLANIVNSHEVQIVRMAAERAEFVEVVNRVAYALGQDERGGFGISRAMAAERLRAVLARVHGGES